MAASVPKKINLLVQEGFENTPLGKALNWLLSVGRVIVVLTQVVVIAAFLSRFWLDRRLSDLNDQNNGLKTQIEARSSFESEFRDSQKRLSVYQEVYNNKTNAAKAVKDIALLLPADVSLSNISFSEGTLSLAGVALSEKGLAGFIKALDNSNSFQNPVLGEVSLETGGQQLIKFSVKVELTNKERRMQENGNRS